MEVLVSSEVLNEEDENAEVRESQVVEPHEVEFDPPEEATKIAALDESREIPFGQSKVRILI